MLQHIHDIRWPDACSLQQVQSAFASSGGSFDQLLLSVVGSDSFRTRPVEAQP